jgi:hypothetical protein
MGNFKPIVSGIPPFCLSLFKIMGRFLRANALKEFKTKKLPENKSGKPNLN